MTPAPHTSPPLATTPQLRTATFDDYPQIERLESAYGLLTLSPENWRALWVDNPARAERGRGRDMPIGWVLEAEDGAVVGSLANVPTRYVLDGVELLAVTGRAWVVQPDYRGIALWLMEEYFFQDRVDLFVNTTVNALAVDAFSAFGSLRVPVGDWSKAAFFVTNRRGFAASALRIKGVPCGGLLAYPAAAALWLKDAVSAKRPRVASSSSNIAQVDGFGPAFDAFWSELVGARPGVLLAVRDGRTLRWHFGGALREGRVWVFTASRNGLLRAYCVLKRQDHPPSGLSRMRLVDYQSLEPGEDLLPGLLEAALRRCVSEGIHVLEHVGCDLPKMQCFDRSAPYRRDLPAWPFYFKAAGPVLDAALQKPEAWAPSAFDGDTSL